MSFTSPALDRSAHEVCRAYPVLASGYTLLPLGNHGGFSGARLWRVRTFAGDYCLRAWPAGSTDQGKELVWIHQLMRDAVTLGLDFVPQVCLTRRDQTLVVAQGRLWELAPWMPGRADFRDNPTLARITAVMEGLARLHLVWHGTMNWLAKSDAVHRRLSRLQFWKPECQIRAWEALKLPRSGLRELSFRAMEQLRRWLDPAESALGSWVDRVVPLQPCLCDIWHDHILFEGNRLTGIVDYGTVRPDSVAVDLARLIGSLFGDNLGQRQAALEAYSALRHLESFERRLMNTLDWTGVVVGAGNWLRWLYLENRVFENSAGVVQRLSELVTRMESWKRPGIVS
jgi:homoserine kinase type II